MELVDVNDRGQAAGMTGTFNPKTGFTGGEALDLAGRLGVAAHRSPSPRRLAATPSSSRTSTTSTPAAAIVGNVYGLAGRAYDKLRRIDPVLWTCQFGR